MTTISALANGSCNAIFEGLKAEFGAIVAARILEAEAMDFIWDARLKECYLGQHWDVGLAHDDDEIELSRIAAMSFIGGRWFAAVCLVDGEGRPADLLWKQSFERREEAEAAFVRAS